MSEREITRRLAHWDEQDREAMDALLAAVYDQLLRLARHDPRTERDTYTLNATGLLHEAWLKLVSEGEHPWSDRAQFFSAASHAMRRLLVDYARGGADLDPSVAELLAVDAALQELSAVNDR